MAHCKKQKRKAAEQIYKHIGYLRFIHFKFSFPKEKGMRSETFKTSIAPSEPLIIMSADGASSKRTCRHAPHGKTPPLRVHTAAALTFLSPFENALNKAERSAQLLRP
jgi:hypothetical protein